MAPIRQEHAPTGKKRILVEGSTCWRLARAERAAVIIDAAAYFAAAKASILQARHTVFLIGWDFDLRIELERDDPRPGIPDELGEFLTHVVETKPELRIFVLRWDLSFLKFPFRATMPLKLLDWLSGTRLDLRVDHEHPLGGCHHQKIVVVDDGLAFCGGIDMTTHRWDTPAHRDEDPRRCDAGGEPYPPWHDATICIEGEAARALGELARDRWQLASGETIPPAPRCDPCWPPDLAPDFADVEFAIARTAPAYGDKQSEVREIERLYLAAIAAAERTIYIETQYFASHRIAAALCARLQEERGPEVVVVNPQSATGWLEEKVMGAARAVLVQDLIAADRFARFRIYTPVTDAGEDIYVHAKVVAIDDRLLRVGSSNVNNRSLGLDTECDLAIEACDRQGEPDEVRRTILDVRDRLVAEHLGVNRDDLRQSLSDEGSLIGAIERLRRERGRSLVPFTPPPLSEDECAMARSAVLDPSRPEPISETVRRGLTVPGVRKAVGLGLAAAAGMVALGLLSRRI